MEVEGDQLDKTMELKRSRGIAPYSEDWQRVDRLWKSPYHPNLRLHRAVGLTLFIRTA